MAKNNNHVRGMNVYLDDKGRDVYYDRLFTKCGYLIQEKDKGTYAMYANRFIIPIIAAVLAMNFILTEKQSIIMGIGLYFILEALFRFKFLPSLTKLKKFKPTKKLRLVEQIQTLGRNKLLLLSILLVVLAVLILINAYTEGYSGLVLVLNYIFAIGAVFYAVTYIRAFMQIK